MAFCIYLSEEKPINMKKIKKTRKLNLSKVTLSNFAAIKGGGGTIKCASQKLLCENDAIVNGTTPTGANSACTTAYTICWPC
jgi:hypothetical protein